MDYLRKRFRFEYGTVENKQQYRDNWEATFGKKEEPRPEEPKLPVKLAADCRLCDLCDEPYCDECDEHYADCKHPGPNSEE